jgi:hypothetical protein
LKGGSKLTDVGREDVMTSRAVRNRLGVVVMAATAMAGLGAGSVLNAGAPGETGAAVERALLRLPYYGVFDFLAYGVEKGTVTLVGYAYRGNLRSDAEQAVRRVTGVEEVVNKIDVLPASADDDRIRWATFYNIYTDEFLSRYAPGGGITARYDTLRFARFPGMQPFGMYPIHIIVTGGKTTLVGIVDNEGDKIIAGIRATEVARIFGVENELVVDKR